VRPKPSLQSVDHFIGVKKVAVQLQAQWKESCGFFRSPVIKSSSAKDSITV
jgi:hypothetical protein